MLSFCLIFVSPRSLGIFVSSGAPVHWTAWMDPLLLRQTTGTVLKPPRPGESWPYKQPTGRSTARQLHVWWLICVRCVVRVRRLAAKLSSLLSGSYRTISGDGGNESSIKRRRQPTPLTGARGKQPSYRSRPPTAVTSPPSVQLSRRPLARRMQDETLAAGAGVGGG